MNKQRKTKNVGIILAMFLLVLPLSFGISIDSVSFTTPIGVGFVQYIDASISSLNPINSVKIEIDGINRTMLLVSGVYEYTYIPQISNNVSFRIYAIDNESIIMSNGVFEVKDLTPPNVISSSPSGKVKDTTQILNLVTNEAASCRFEEFDTDYASMSYNFDGLSTSHSFTLNGLTSGIKNYYVRCIDNNGNMNSNSYVLTFTIDTTPPLIVTKDPINNINLETYTISITTDEDAECKYSESNINYNSLSGFFNGLKTTHTALLTHLSQGQKVYYVGCKDLAGNIVYDTLNFSVNLGSSAEIVLSKSSPLSANTYNVRVITSKPLSSAPHLQYIFDDEQRLYDISLIGADNSWNGYLVISPEAKDRIGTFRYSGIDYDGLTGTKITSGAMFVVDTTKPIAPTSVDAIIKNNKVEISWFYNGETPDSFKVYRSDKSGVEYVDEYDKKGNTPFIDSGVENGKTYYYRIAAVDKAGNVGDLSSEVIINYVKEVSDTDKDTIEPILHLSFNLEKDLNQTYSKIKTLKFDIEYSKNQLEKETDRFKNLLIKKIGLVDKENNAKVMADNLLLELDTIRGQNLDENTFNERISGINKVYDELRKDVILNVDIVDSLEFNYKAGQSDIESAVNGMVKDLKITDEEKSNYTKKTTSYQDKSNVFETIIIARLKSVDSNERFISLVLKEITSTDSGFDIVLYEDLSNNFASSADDVIFLNTPKSVKENVAIFGFPKLENIDIAYYINSKKDLSDVKDSKTIILPEPLKFFPKRGVTGGSIEEETSSDNKASKITGNFIFSKLKVANFKEFIFLGIGVFIITGLLVYYFFFINDNGNNGIDSDNETKSNKKIKFENVKIDSSKIMSDEDIEHKHLMNLIEHADNHANNLNFDQASKEYALIYSIFTSNLKDSLKKNEIAPKIHVLHKKISSNQKIMKAKDSVSNNDLVALKNLLDEIESVKNSFSIEDKSPLKNYLREYHDYYSFILKKGGK